MRNRLAIAAYLIACISTVRCHAPLELGDHQATVNTEPQNIEPVALCATLDDPPVILDGNNHHARSQDLGIGDDPLLQMLTLQQPSGLQRPGGHRSRRSSRLHRQQQLTFVHTPPRRAAELPGPLWDCPPNRDPR
jgi:hypothetical protein